MTARAKASVDQTYGVFLRDGNGDPVTTLTDASAGLFIKHARERAAAVSITPAAQTVAGAHVDGGFVHVANGYYRVDSTDAVQASGVDRATLLIGATGVKTEAIEIDLPSDDQYVPGFTLQQIADANVDNVTVDGDTLREAWRLVTAALAGLNTGTSAIPVLKSRDGVKTRITSNADRTSLTIDKA